MFTHPRRISLGLCVAMLLAGGSVASLTFARPPKNDNGGNANYAFVHNVYQKGLFLTTIDGANTFQLTRPSGRFDYDRSPSWSPDLDPQTEGHQGVIAYLRYLNDDELTYLCVINSDGSGNQLIRAFGPYEPRPEDPNGEEVLVWSPNGKEILFSDNDLSSADTDQDSGIYAVDVATGNVRTIMGRELIDGFSYGPARPSISPLGLLAFEFLSEVYVVEFVLDENGLMHVDPQAEWINISVNAPDQQYPVWSPDGTYLAFTSYDDSVAPWVSQLIIYDVLLDEIAASIPGVNPWQQVTWSPDGAEIGCMYPSGVNRQGEIIAEIHRIADWDDPGLRQFIPVTMTDRDEEFAPHWNPGWVSP